MHIIKHYLTHNVQKIFILNVKHDSYTSNLKHYTPPLPLPNHLIIDRQPKYNNCPRLQWPIGVDFRVLHFILLTDICRGCLHSAVSDSDSDRTR